MIDLKNNGKEESLSTFNRKNKLKKYTEASKLLTNTINKYQYNIVGWTEFCIDKKNLKQKTLTKYQEKPLENLRLKERNLFSISTPPLKTIFESKDTYIIHLDKEYDKDQAFYEAILKNPGKYRTDIDDKLINEEIDKYANKYLQNINKRKDNEKAIINSLKPEDWFEINKSKYPKIQLGLVLGLPKETLINNFGLYYLNQLKAEFLGSKTAYLSSSGPSSWHEIDQIQKELEYFKKEVVTPMIKKINKDKNKGLIS